MTTETAPAAATPTAEAFHRDGFFQPLPILTREQCDLIVRHYKSDAKRKEAEWIKSLAVTDRFYFDVAARPKLLELLTPILGPDIILWGCSLVLREPGQIHPWHSDIESSGPEGGFASIWIGLKNTSRESALRIIPGSHLYGPTIQEARQRHGVDRTEATDDAVLAWAREHDPRADLVETDMTDGDAIVFDGRLWHSTNNRRAEGRRFALLLQYARADRAVYRPYPHRVDWPFGFDTERRPPVVAVQGLADESLNRVLDPPDYAATELDPLAAEHHHLTVPLPPDGDALWTPHRMFRGPTPNLGVMRVHASVLMPGHSPHPPHAHAEEELLIVLDGRGELLLGKNDDPDRAERVPVSTGSMAYYPAWQFHSLRNSGEAPITYLMFKWMGAPHETDLTLGTQVVHTSGLTPKPRPGKPLDVERILNAPTHYLGRLHAHLSEVDPGRGYDAHADDYDVAIVVFSGKLQVNDDVAGPNTVLYYAGGTLHGLTNIGADRARYLVFEFERPIGRKYSATLPGDKRRRKRGRKREKRKGLARIVHKLKRALGRA
jgi:mannose-6-phosphate isomerase-like protein (cupin superfamily)